MKTLQSNELGQVQYINTKKHYNDFLTIEKSRKLKSGIKVITEIYSKKNPSRLLAIYTKVFNHNDSFQHSLWSWSILGNLHSIMGDPKSGGWFASVHPKQSFKSLSKTFSKFETKGGKY